MLSSVRQKDEALILPKGCQMALKQQRSLTVREKVKSWLDVCVLRQKGYILGYGRSFRKPLLEWHYWTRRGQDILGAVDFQRHWVSTNLHTLNCHWKALLFRWSTPLLPHSAWCWGSLKISERKNSNRLLVKLLFVSMKVQRLGDVYIHICTHTYVFTCLQWNQATWKIPFHWLNSSWRIPPGNAFVQYVSYIMCRGLWRPRDMMTALVKQLMDEPSSSWPHRLQSQLTSAQRLTTCIPFPDFRKSADLGLICCLQLS